MKTAAHYRALAKNASNGLTRHIRTKCAIPICSSRAFGSILPLDLATYP